MGQAGAKELLLGQIIILSLADILRILELLTPLGETFLFQQSLGIKKV